MFILAAPPHLRTPAYSSANRTDLWLLPDRVALVLKCCTTACGDLDLDRQWAEDLAYYAARSDCPTLVGLVYDPERRIPDPASRERAWSRQDEREARGLIVS